MVRTKLTGAFADWGNLPLPPPPKFDADLIADELARIESEEARWDALFERHGVTHYCVANMPGAVPRTSTYALNNATLPFVMEIASKGGREAINSNPHLANGLTVADGHIAHEQVARDLGMAFKRPDWFVG